MHLLLEQLLLLPQLGHRLEEKHVFSYLFGLLLLIPKQGVVRFGLLLEVDGHFFLLAIKKRLALVYL